MLRKVIRLGILLAALSATADARQGGVRTIAKALHPGDIVFQYIPCGALCNAIVATTPCAPGRPFNHCGIVQKTGGAVMIIEAIGKDVHATTLADFLKRDTSTQLFVGRPVSVSDLDIAGIIRTAQGFQGRPYDDAFLPGESALYCSELVYAAYTAAGKPIFSLAPMTLKSPQTGTTFPAWTDYYTALQSPVPEGQLGINPCAIAHDPAIHLMTIRKQ